MREMIGKAKEAMEQAYQMLGRIPVSGDGVDYMAGARASLRQGWQALSECEGALEEVQEDAAETAE